MSELTNSMQMLLTEMTTMFMDGTGMRVQHDLLNLR